MMSKYLLISLVYVCAYLFHVTVASEAIVGGVKARAHQFPYQVAVLVHPGPILCGGGILNDYFILSAAHCVINDTNGQFEARQAKVLAGSIDLYVVITESTPFVEVKKIYIPTEYKPPPDKATGDIAVLKLKSPLGLSKHEHLKPLHLPKDNKHETYHRKTAKIAGFGLQYMKQEDGEEVGGHFDFFLRYALADILDDEQCNNHPKQTITEKHLCARIQQHHDIKRGVCTGDSGGPLVIDHTVIGVLSTSPYGCSEHKLSGVYTRVWNYIPFIESSMKEEPRNDTRVFELQ